jgi:hypothetical protein
MFDRWTRQMGRVAVADGISRRDVLRRIAGAALGAALVASDGKVRAKRRGEGKRKIVDALVCHNGQTRKATKKGMRNHVRHGDTRGPCPRGATCGDGVQNGTETDVDCGGTCPRCAPGQTCATRSDCATALCTGGACQQCVLPADCGLDSDGSMCACRDNAAQQRVCTKLNGRFIAGGTCADCLAGEQCTLPPGGAECLLPCGV